MLLLLLTSCAATLKLDSSVEEVELPVGAIVFVDATLVPSGERADVVVLDGLIAELRDPGGAYLGELTVIDASGRFLSPGLADLHVHSYYPGDLWLYLAHGVTTVRNLFGNPLHLAWRADIEAGELAGPTLLTSGPIIDGPVPYWPGSVSVSTAEEAREVAREQAAMGYDALKVYDGLPADAWRALVEAAAEEGLPVVGHVPDEVGYADVAAGGQRSVEHLDDWLAGAAGVAPFSTFDRVAGDATLAALTDEAALAFATDTAASGVFNIPTLTVWDQLGHADTWDFDDPRLDTMPSEVAASWRSTQRVLRAADVAWFASYTEALCGFTAALHAAGAPMAVGTDVINPFVFPGDSVHAELELLVGCGLSPAEALAMATTGAAAAVEQPGVFGEIRVGARADLLLLEADPREDIAVTRAPLGVMARGRYFTAEALAVEVAAVAESYR